MKVSKKEVLLNLKEGKGKEIRDRLPRKSIDIVAEKFKVTPDMIYRVLRGDNFNIELLEELVTQAEIFGEALNSINNRLNNL